MLALEENECLLADGFEDALIGITEGMNPVAVYDYESCVHILTERDMSYGAAVAYMDFNVTGAYVGEKTPVFVRVQS